MDGNVVTEATANIARKVMMLSSFEFWLSVLILIFGALVILAQFQLLKHLRSTANDVLKIFTLSLIIVGTLFSITAGFDAQTVAPAMGLFGTIAGYLLGRRNDTNDNIPHQQAGEKRDEQI